MAIDSTPYNGTCLTNIWFFLVAKDRRPKNQKETVFPSIFIVMSFSR